MKVKPTLSPTATSTQRWAPSLKAGSRVEQLASATIPVRAGQKESSFNVLVKIVNKPLRISVPVITTHPLLRGKKSFLHTVRAVALESWHANARVPAA